MADPDSVDITVTGEPALARNTVTSALTARGFTLTWSDEWNGVAKKGSRGKQAILGTFALYLEVGVNVFAANNATVVRLTRPSTGVSGGLAGRAKSKSQFASLTNELSEVFRSNGVLLSAAAPSPADPTGR